MARARRTAAALAAILLATGLQAGCVIVPDALLPDPTEPGPSTAGPSGAASPPAQAPTTKPTGPVAPYRPAFKTLRFGPDDGRGSPEVDYSGIDLESQQLARDLRQARFPAHSCRPPVIGLTSYAAIERRSEAYANCLLDAWRPWLAAHGAIEPTRVRLHHCGLKENFTSADCTGKEGVTWNPTTGVFHLHDGFDLWGRKPGDITAQLGRMVAGVLQEQVHVRAGQDVLTMGVEDQPAPWSRRRELQAECLSAGMASAAKDPAARRMVAQRSYYDAGELYWDAAAQKYWHQRGVKESVVGECDAVVAAPELVGYRGR
ncbi:MULTISPECIES: hypothetical protein [unclassified Luteococcus]|uniref:hypothetical protein n=1 Tax=unclassified Luteococcus TaxID=2639923 RepID=UPI00313BC568